MDYCNDLPDYLIGRIFSFLTELKDKRNIRLVCRDWREIFQDFDNDTIINANIQTQKCLEDVQKCSVPISAFNFHLDSIQLEKPLQLDAVATNQNKILENVKQIIFTVDEPSSQSQSKSGRKQDVEYCSIEENVYSILNSLLYLESLAFIIDRFHIPIQLNFHSGFWLNNLTDLMIKVTSVIHLNLFSDLQSVSMPSLKSINLGFLSDKMYYSDPNIVGFILNGHTIVKEIDQEICQPYYDLFALLLTYSSTLRNVQLTYPAVLEFNQQVRQKTENEKIQRDIFNCPLKLDKLTLNFLGETDRDNGDPCDLATYLLRSQKNLIELKYETVAYPMLGWAGYVQFLDSVNVNSGTLKRVIISNRKPDFWSYWEVPLFEGTIALASCNQLDSLKLNYFRIPSEILHFIPQTLKKLSLIGGLDPLTILPKIFDTLQNLENLIFLPLPLPIQVQQSDPRPITSLSLYCPQMRDCLLDIFSMSKLTKIEIPHEYFSWINQFQLDILTYSIKNMQSLNSFELVTVQITLSK